MATFAQNSGDEIVTVVHATFIRHHTAKFEPHLLARRLSSEGVIILTYHFHQLARDNNVIMASYRLSRTV